MQSAVTALKEVRDDKVENRSGITQEDASKIAKAESDIHGGQIPVNSVAGKAQVGSNVCHLVWGSYVSRLTHAFCLTHAL